MHAAWTLGRSRQSPVRREHYTRSYWNVQLLNAANQLFEAIDDLLRRQAVGVHLDRVGGLGQAAEGALDVALVAAALLFEHHRKSTSSPRARRS